MTVRGCVPLCMYLDNEKCVYGILLRRISCFRVDRHGYCVFGGSKKAVSLTSPTTFQSDTTLSGMVMRRPIRVYSDIGPQLAAKRPAVSSSRRRRSPRRPRPSRLLSPTQPTLSTAHLRPRALTHIHDGWVYPRQHPPTMPEHRGRRPGDGWWLQEKSGGRLALRVTSRLLPRAWRGPRDGDVDAPSLRWPAAGACGQRAPVRSSGRRWRLGARGSGAPAGAAARWRPWQQTHLPCPQAGRRGQGRR